MEWESLEWIIAIIVIDNMLPSTSLNPAQLQALLQFHAVANVGRGT
jgi:hypothetical protein